MLVFQDLEGLTEVFGGMSGRKLPLWAEFSFLSCGCPKFPAGNVFRQISTLLENDSPIFRQREMLSLPRFGHFPARKTAAGKLAAPAGTLLHFLLRDFFLATACKAPSERFGGLLSARSERAQPKQQLQQVHMMLFEGRELPNNRIGMKNPSTESQ